MTASSPTPTLLLTIVLVGLATYAIRASLFVWPTATSSPRVQQVLRRVPAAILPVLVVSTLNASTPTALPERTLAALAAAAVAWRTHDVTATLVVGMAALWLLSW